MIILFSDIHLTDTPERTTFPTDFFFTKLEAAITRGQEDVTVVLLGDIFEILKSSQWLEKKVRPWQKCDQLHVQTVEAIVRGIIKSNEPFFEGIRDLKKRFPHVRFEYIPGNHDRPINTDMGVTARALLQAELPLLGKANGDKFNLLFTNKQHKLIAKHGHEWDTSNRYEEFKGEKAAFGDAIVIDLVLCLPSLVAEKLKIEDPADPLLWALNEIDNIRPHTVRVIAQWLNGSLDQLKQLNPKAPKAINEAMTQLAKNLRKLALENSFESFTLGPVKRLSTWALLNTITMRGFLKVAHRLPLGEAEAGTEIKFALDDFQSRGDEYEYLVSGHTHEPMVIPMSGIGRRRPGFYINTGTWRRIRPVTQSLKVSSAQLPFACWDEGSIASIFNEREQQQLHLPAFDLQKLTRGT